MESLSEEKRKEKKEEVEIDVEVPSFLVIFKQKKRRENKIRAMLERTVKVSHLILFLCVGGGSMFTFAHSRCLTDDRTHVCSTMILFYI